MLDNSFSITVACLINNPIIETNLILILTFLEDFNSLINRLINYEFINLLATFEC